MSSEAANKELLRELQALFPSNIHEFLDAPTVKAAYDRLKLSCDEYYLTATAFQADRSGDSELGSMKHELLELKDRLNRALEEEHARRQGANPNQAPNPLTFNLADSLAALGRAEAEAKLTTANPATTVSGQAAVAQAARLPMEKTVEVDLKKLEEAGLRTKRTDPVPPPPPKQIKVNASKTKFADGGFTPERFMTTRNAAMMSFASLALTLVFGGYAIVNRPAPVKPVAQTLDWTLIDKRIRDVSATHAARDIQSKDAKTTEQLRELADRQAAFQRDVATRLQKLETQGTKRTEAAAPKEISKQKKAKKKK